MLSASFLRIMTTNFCLLIWFWVLTRVALGILEFTVYNRLASDSQRSSCFCYMRPVIKAVCHHTTVTVFIWRQDSYFKVSIIMSSSIIYLELMRHRFLVEWYWYYILKLLSFKKLRKIIMHYNIIYVIFTTSYLVCVNKMFKTPPFLILFINIP